MKYVVLLLLLSGTAQAGKQDEWSSGCVNAFVLFAEKTKTRTENEARTVGTNTCSELAQHITSKNMWDRVDSKQPKFEGCMSAVRLMLDNAEIQDPKQRKAILADYCLGA